MNKKLFDFKEPKIVKNKELEKAIKNYNKNNDKYVIKSEYDYGRIFEINRYIKEKNHYEDFLLKKEHEEDLETSKKYYEDGDSKKYFKEEDLKFISYLKETLGLDEDAKKVWYYKTYCPYTNDLVGTGYYNLEIYNVYMDYYKLPRIEKKLDFTYNSYNKYKRTFGDEYTEKHVCTYVAKYKLPSIIKNNIDTRYSKELIDVMKYEWKYETPIIQEDLYIVEDMFDKAKLYYATTSSVELKDIYFSNKLGRYCKTPRGNRQIPSYEIDDLLVKVSNIKEGIELKGTKSDRNVEKEELDFLNKINNILKSTDKNKEKVSRILNESNLYSKNKK